MHLKLRFTSAILICIATCVAACHSSSDSGGGATRPVVAAFNAVPDLPAITFLREEEVWTSLDYGEATGFRSVDADQYDVNFDALLPGDETTGCLGDLDGDDFKDDNECTRLFSESINVLGDTEYVVALLGTYGDLRVVVYDKVPHEFDTTDDDGDPEDENAEVMFYHWSDSLGALDVYLEPPGTNLSAVQVRATLSVGEPFVGLVDEGEYVLTLTEEANPSAAYFTSETFTITRQTRVGLAILDGTLDSTSNIKVARFRDQGGDLLDRRVQTQLRVVHASGGAGLVDVYAQEDYSQALVANFGIGQSTDYAVVDSASLSALRIDVTPAGNVGTLLARELFSLTRGTRNSLYLVDLANGNLDGLHVLDRFRRLAPYAEFRAVNSAGRSIDLYVIPHGNNVFTSTQTETLSNGSSGSVHRMDPGNYDIIIAEAGTDFHLFGPLEVELSGSGIYTLVVTETTDATRADVVLLDDFVNE